MLKGERGRYPSAFPTLLRPWGTPALCRAAVPAVHVEELHWAAQTPLKQDPLLPRDLTPVSPRDLRQSQWAWPGAQAGAPLNHGEGTTIRGCLVMRKEGHE